MKPSRFFLLLATIVSPAALIISGCSKPDTTATATDQVKAAATDVANTASDSWDSIKDYTYDRRVEFTASIDRMTGRFDDKMRDWKAKATDASSNDRASAMKDYDDARADLKTKLTDLGNSTADTWADAKDKVAQSWKHVQASYDKVTGS
jgi:hypothetical protein